MVLVLGKYVTHFSTKSLESITCHHIQLEFQGILLFLETFGLFKYVPIIAVLIYWEKEIQENGTVEEFKIHQSLCFLQTLSYFDSKYIYFDICICICIWYTYFANPNINSRYTWLCAFCKPRYILILFLLLAATKVWKLLIYHSPSVLYPRKKNLELLYP